jgi:hypothetical protein
MLRTFIFDESKSHWIEEEQHLLSQDVCAILDEENANLYLAKKKNLEMPISKSNN